jgi:hypothetical protein
MEPAGNFGTQPDDHLAHRLARDLSLERIALS